MANCVSSMQSTNLQPRKPYDQGASSDSNPKISQFFSVYAHICVLDVLIQSWQLRRGLLRMSSRLVITSSISAVTVTRGVCVVQ